MTWVNMPQELCQQLLELCGEHDPDLRDQFEKHASQFNPREPWQDPPTAAEYARSQYGSDDIEVDDDAAISCSEEGVFVQGWLWVCKEDLERTLAEEVHDP